MLSFLSGICRCRAHGSKSDNFDKSMCTKAKNPFGVLPLVTQKLDFFSSSAYKTDLLGNPYKKCQQFFLLNKSHSSLALAPFFALKFLPHEM